VLGPSDRSRARQDDATFEKLRLFPDIPRLALRIFRLTCTQSSDILRTSSVLPPDRLQIGEHCLKESQMSSPSSSCPSIRRIVILVFLCLALGAFALAQNEQVIYNFTGISNPAPYLTADSAGNLYGVSSHRRFRKPLGGSWLERFGRLGPLNRPL
jgi:hypothetical protein